MSERSSRKDHTGELIKRFKISRALRREEGGRGKGVTPSSFETGRIFTPLTTVTDKAGERILFQQQHANNSLRFVPLGSVEDALVSRGVTSLVSSQYARGLMHSQTIAEFDKQARGMRSR